MPPAKLHGCRVLDLEDQGRCPVGGCCMLREIVFGAAPRMGKRSAHTMMLKRGHPSSVAIIRDAVATVFLASVQVGIRALCPRYGGITISHKCCPAAQRHAERWI